MVVRTTKKVIQVPIDEELLARIDERVGRVAESRAAFIREACRWRPEALKGGSTRSPVHRWLSPKARGPRLGEGDRSAPG